jgi:hypothetical protein
LWKKLTQEHKDYSFLLKKSKHIAWSTFFSYVPLSHFQTVEPFNLYRLMNKSDLSVYTDYQPLGLYYPIYMANIISLYQYGSMYIFPVEGKAAWFNKTIHDIKISRTRIAAERLMNHGGKSGAPFGSKHGRSTLTEDIVMEIKYNRKGISQIKTAEEFSISKSTVYLIMQNQRWAHL